MSDPCLPDRDLSRGPEPSTPPVAFRGPLTIGNWLASGTALVEADGRLILANDAFASWLGITQATLKGQSLARLIGQRHPEWEPIFEDFLQRADGFDRLELGGNEGSGPERLTIELCAHGSTRFLHFESVMPPAPEFEELFPDSSWDRIISDRAFQRMLRSETQWDNLMNRWPGIIFSQRPDFSFIFISPKIEELTGIPASEFRRQSKHFWEMVHEADVEALAARLRGEQESIAGLTCTYRIRHALTGRVTYLWEHRRTTRTANGLLLGFEGIWLDITRQTIAERRLLNMSWRENLGILTLGLAHDFCNIMTGIVGLSETFEGTLEGDNAVRNGLGLIRETALQASHLAHRLRQLHYGSPGEKSYHDLNESIRGMVDLLQKVLPRRVRVLTDLAAGQLPIYVDVVELQQVIVNLALNGADAMPEGGQLTFRTGRHEQVPDAHAFHGSRPHSPVISLSVQDTGSGIPNRFLSSIFDPFFTTKPVGKGSGLGLYNARLFVEKHRSAISVETVEGAGSTFHLWFTEADFTEEPATSTPQRRKRHTILVAGPASERLNATVAVLRKDGYYVVPANGEAAALEALHTPYFEISALIVLCTGAPIEELGLCQRIRAHKLPIKSILSFGNRDEEGQADTILKSVDATIPYNVTPQDFLVRVKSVLG